MSKPYKRKDSPFYWAAYSDPHTGKRVQRSTKQTKLADAKAEVLRWNSEALKRKAAGVTEEITLAEALARFVKQEEMRKKAGWMHHKARADRMTGRIANRWSFEKLQADFPLARLTSADVETLRTHRVAEGYAKNTINHEVKTLARAWRMARAAKCVVADEEVKFKLFKPEAKQRALTPEEFHAVYRELDPSKSFSAPGQKPYVPGAGTKTARDRREAQDIYLGLVLTGGRWGELAKLTTDSIDQLDWSSLRLWGWKTNKERLVPMADLLRQMLERRLKERPGAIYVFPSPAVKPGEDPDRPRAAPSRAIHRAMTRAGCNAPHLVARYGRATIHSLRHTFATWQRRYGGAGLDEVQILLGHADIATTKIYAHIEPEETVKKAAQALDRIVGCAVTADPPDGPAN